MIFQIVNKLKDRKPFYASKVSRFFKNMLKNHIKMNVSLFVIHDFDNEYFVRDCHFDFFFFGRN